MRAQLVPLPLKNPRIPSLAQMDFKPWIVPLYFGLNGFCTCIRLLRYLNIYPLQEHFELLTKWQSLWAQQSVPEPWGYTDKGLDVQMLLQDTTVPIMQMNPQYDEPNEAKHTCRRILIRSNGATAERELHTKQRKGSVMRNSKVECRNKTNTILSTGEKHAI